MSAAVQARQRDFSPLFLRLSGEYSLAAFSKPQRVHRFDRGTDLRDDRPTARRPCRRRHHAPKLKQDHPPSRGAEVLVSSRLHLLDPVGRRQPFIRSRRPPRGAFGVFAHAADDFALAAKPHAAS
jgi:hypothetical protein